MRALRQIFFASNRSHANPLFFASNILPVNMLQFETVSKRLQRMQMKAIRLITFSDFDAHTSPLFFWTCWTKTLISYQTSNDSLHVPIHYRKITKDFRLIFVKASIKRNVNTRFETRTTFYVPKFEQTMVNLIFDTMDLYYGMKTPHSFKRDYRSSSLSSITFYHYRYILVFLLFINFPFILLL